VSSPSKRSSFGLQSKTFRFVLFLTVIFGSMSFSSVAGQPANGRVVVFPTTIQWNKQKSVSRYRLQIAADEKFQDVFFDAPINGNRYTVEDLSPGPYYWRVAAAEDQLGTFSCPVRFFLSGGVITPVKLPNRGVGSR
jgi:hypothetical protein